MNSKSFLASLLILAFLASFAQGLYYRPDPYELPEKIPTHFGQRKNYQSKSRSVRHERIIHMAKQFSTKIQSHLCELLHVQNEDSMDDPFLNELMGFAMNDEEIYGSLMNGQPLSPEAAGRIKDFFKSSQTFKTQLHSIFEGEDTPDCLKNLNNSQKNKIVEIIIENMDFHKILNGSQDKSSPDDKTLNKIIESIQADKELGDDVVTCYKDNPDAFQNSV